MKTCCRILFLLGTLAMFGSSAPAATTQPVIDPDPLKAIGLLRADLIDSFNKGDVDRLLSHLDPDVVITWQNGEVCRGPDAVRAYYNKMMFGDHPIVSKLSTDPVIDDRHVYGDWAVSWGNLHDSYVLSNGTEFKLDSRFTATIARRGDAWKVTSFHASVDAFDNPILHLAEKKTGLWAGIGGGAGGILIGAFGAMMLRRKKTS